MVGRPVGQRHADARMAVVTAGMHQARVFGGKSFAIRDVIRIRGFRNTERIDIEAQCRDRTGAARVKNGQGARVTLHGGKLFLRDAFGVGALLSGFDFFFVAAHYKFGIDDFKSLANVVSEGFQMFNNDGCRAEFSPAGFRLCMDGSTQGRHFFGIAFYEIKHDWLFA